MAQENESDPLLKLVEKSSTVIVKQLLAIHTQLAEAEKKTAKIEKSVGCLLTLFVVLAVFGGLAVVFLVMVPR